MLVLGLWNEIFSQLNDWVKSSYIRCVFVLLTRSWRTEAVSQRERSVKKSGFSLDKLAWPFTCILCYLRSFYLKFSPICQASVWAQILKIFYYCLLHLIRFLISLQIVLLRCFENITDKRHSWRLYEILEPWYRIFAAQRTVQRIFSWGKNTSI